MKTLAIGTLVVGLAAASVAMAQPRPYEQYNRDHGQGGDNGHAGWGQDRGEGHQWGRGQRMGYNDWNNAQPVDYRAHRLRQPPRGYEWRQSNGQFVLGALATGLIASAILSDGR
jgi:Ni/Co efflux regulator RcnB